MAGVQGMGQLVGLDQMKQIKEFLNTYNKITEQCFGDCVNDFGSRNVISKENNCVSNCVQKYLKSTSRIGFLHIGGLRTALINFLFAKSKGMPNRVEFKMEVSEVNIRINYPGGEFVLRVEDTDQSRVVPGAINHLVEQLAWVGIIPDEGPMHGDFGPYVQSERLHLYEKCVDQLLHSGSAYRCFCSERRLEIMRRDQLMRNEASRYDNRCRYLTADQIQQKLKADEPFVIRFKLQDEAESFQDMFSGTITINVSGIEGDPVIFKSDGYPTYHLANVVDDHLMKITHVLRGKEWINSTPKHLMLYAALGWSPPEFGHLPLFLNEDKKKLSKRQGDVFVEQYREKGYHPSALLNFMMTCGMGYSDGPVMFGDDLCSPKTVLKEMVPSCDLSKIGTTDSVIQFWKLDEINSKILKHLARTDAGLESLTQELNDLLISRYGERNPLTGRFTKTDANKYISSVLRLRAAHIKTLKCLLSDDYEYVWRKPVPEIADHDRNMRGFTNNVSKMLSQLESLPDTKVITNKIRSIAKDVGLKMPAAMTLLRLLLTGRKDGPAVAEIITIIGIEEAIQRIHFINSDNPT